MKLFKEPVLIETPPPHPLEAALSEAEKRLEEARRGARVAAEKLASAEAQKETCATELDVERRRLRAEEEARSLAERCGPLVREVADLDAGIDLAVRWLRDAIERREQLADRARRIATANLCRPCPKGVTLAEELAIPALRSTGTRERIVELTIPYSLGPVPNPV
ncbi:MAG: hypothetical protein ACYC4P_07225 [Thermoanaerobaculia bacterium]